MVLLRKVMKRMSIDQVQLSIWSILRANSNLRKLVNEVLKQNHRYKKSQSMQKCRWMPSKIGMSQ